MAKNKKHKKTQKAFSKEVIISESNGWAQGKLKVSYDESVELGKFNSGKLYGHLTDKYLDDPRLLSALSYGLVDHDKGQCGVKLISKKLYELKIQANKRVYTTKLYKNEKGDYLLNFDKDTNHKGIERIIKATKKFDIIPVQDLIENESDMLNVIGGSDSSFDNYDLDIC